MTHAPQREEKLSGASERDPQVPLPRVRLPGYRHLIRSPENEEIRKALLHIKRWTTNNVTAMYVEPVDPARWSLPRICEKIPSAFKSDDGQRVNIKEILFRATASLISCGDNSWRISVAGTLSNAAGMFVQRMVMKTLSKAGFPVTPRDHASTLVVQTCNVGFEIDLDGFYRKHQVCCDQPANFPGTVYRLPKAVPENTRAADGRAANLPGARENEKEKNPTLVIFETGKLTLTGHKSEYEALENFMRVFPLLYEFRRGASTGKEIIVNETQESKKSLVRAISAIRDATAPPSASRARLEPLAIEANKK